MMMEGDAGRRAVVQWVRDRENARAGVSDDPLAQGANDSSASLPTMSPAALRAAATANEGYETPELNDRLYLHYKGYRRIENLEPYCNLKALFLDSNGLSTIENLSHLHQLRCLYLQNNLIEKIQGLEGLTSLVTLELSHNRIFQVEGLSHLINLQTLNLAHNYLGDIPSLEGLISCPALSNVDLSNNNIEDLAVVEGVLARMPALVSINLAGNGVVTNTPQFRKKVICAMPRLRYMDRPIFEMERLASEAWGRGGREAEVAAREAYCKKQRDEHRAQLQAYRDWVAETRRKKLEELAQRQQQQQPPAAGGVGQGAAAVTETEGQRRAREEREAAARVEAEAERAMIQEPGAVQKLGAKFWATGGGHVGQDSFGQPRSNVGKEIFVQEDVEEGVVAGGEEGEVPPLFETLSLDEPGRGEGREEAGIVTEDLPSLSSPSTGVEKVEGVGAQEMGVDSENVLLEVD